MLKIEEIRITGENEHRLSASLANYNKTHTEHLSYQKFGSSLKDMGSEY